MDSGQIIMTYRYLYIYIYIYINGYRWSQTLSADDQKMFHHGCSFSQVEVIATSVAASASFHHADVSGSLETLPSGKLT